MALRIRTHWHDDDAERSIEEIASAIAFNAWRIAKNMAINLHGEDFVYDNDEQRFGVIVEYLLFQLALTDRIASERLELDDDTRRLLRTSLHMGLVVDELREEIGPGDFVIRKIEPATLGRHVTRTARVPFDRVPRERLHALCETISPLRRVADDRSAADADPMAGDTRRVVDLWAGHRRCDGLGLGRGLDNRCVRLVLLSREINVADRTNALRNRSLVFSGLAREHFLRPLGHLEGKHENADRHNDEHADDEGIHVKKFLVPTQGNAPEKVGLRFVLADARRWRAIIYQYV